MATETQLANLYEQFHIAAEQAHEHTLAGPLVTEMAKAAAIGFELQRFAQMQPGTGFWLEYADELEMAYDAIIGTVTAHRRTLRFEKRCAIVRKIVGMPHGNNREILTSCFIATANPLECYEACLFAHSTSKLNEPSLRLLVEILAKHHQVRGCSGTYVVLQIIREGTKHRDELFPYVRDVMARNTLFTAEEREDLITMYASVGLNI